MYVHTHLHTNTHTHTHTHVCVCVYVYIHYPKPQTLNTTLAVGGMDEEARKANNGVLVMGSALLEAASTTFGCIRQVYISYTCVFVCVCV